MTEDEHITHYASLKNSKTFHTEESTTSCDAATSKDDFNSNNNSLTLSADAAVRMSPKPPEIESSTDPPGVETIEVNGTLKVIVSGTLEPPTVETIDQDQDYFPTPERKSNSDSGSDENRPRESINNFSTIDVTSDPSSRIVDISNPCQLAGNSVCNESDCNNHSHSNNLPTDEKLNFRNQDYSSSNTVVEEEKDEEIKRNQHLVQNTIVACEENITEFESLDSEFKEDSIRNSQEIPVHSDTGELTEVGENYQSYKTAKEAKDIILYNSTGNLSLQPNLEICRETNNSSNSYLPESDCRRYSDSEVEMGRRSLSFKGRTPHMVYTEEEFKEHYTTLEKGKSLDSSAKQDVKRGFQRIKAERGGRPLRHTRSLSTPPSEPYSSGITPKGKAMGRPISMVEKGTDTSDFFKDQDANIRIRGLVSPNETNNNKNIESFKIEVQPELMINPCKETNVSAETLQQRSTSQQGRTSRGPFTVQDLSIISGYSDRKVGVTKPYMGNSSPSKQNRISLTKHLQSKDQVDGQINGSDKWGHPVNVNMDVRKTEIAVERQMILKQVMKEMADERFSPRATIPVSEKLQNESIPPTNTGFSRTDKSRTLPPQTLSVQLAGPFTVTTRIVDGEEELILGSLPLPPRPQSVPPGSKQFRHFACIEPVGQPVVGHAPRISQIEPVLVCPTKRPSSEDSQPMNSISFSKERPKMTDSNIVRAEEGPGSLSAMMSVTVTASTMPELQKPEVTLVENVVKSANSETQLRACNTTDGSLIVPRKLDVEPIKSPKSPVDESATETRSTVPVIGSTSPTPVLETTSATPVLETTSTTPVLETTPTTPVLESTPTTPVLESTSTTPVLESTPTTPVLESTSTTPVLETTSTTPVIETASTTPVLENTSATPLSKTPSTSSQPETISPMPQSQIKSETTPVPSNGNRNQFVFPSVSRQLSRNTTDVNEDDEDFGIYDASFRNSGWIYIGGNQELQMITGPVQQSQQQTGKQYTKNKVVKAQVECRPSKNEKKQDDDDDVFSREDPARESVTTTASEEEFKQQYRGVALRRIQRKQSIMDYQRLSLIAREREVIVVKENNLFGFRIQYSKPVVVTDIDQGGAAEKAGLKVGDMVLSVNGQDVTQALHSQVVKLAAAGPDSMVLLVGTNVCNTLNLEAIKPILTGYLWKLSSTGVLRSWKKRWFVLKHDNVIYYYKTKEDAEPLGAIVLCNYTVQKARDVGKPNAFKITKHKAKTYHLYSSTAEEMNSWAKAITEAARPNSKADIWLDISTHNVSVPALCIKYPDCQGILTKMGGKHKTWKRRYCVLKDACLYYYKDIDAPHALGVAHFHGYSIQETEIGSKKYAFIMKPPEEKLRTFYFIADHETDRKRWVAAFAYSIGRWIQTNTGDDSDEECNEMLI